MKRTIWKIIIDGKSFDTVKDAAEGSGLKDGGLRFKLAHADKDVRSFTYLGHKIKVVYKGDPGAAKPGVPRKPLIKNKPHEFVPTGPVTLLPPATETEEAPEIIADKMAQIEALREEFRSYQVALLRLNKQSKTLAIRLYEMTQGGA